MLAVYALVSLQGLWILLAFLHHRGKLRVEARTDGGIHRGPLSLPPSLASLWLPLLRYLTFLDLPALGPTSASPPWLNHDASVSLDDPPSLRRLGRSLKLKGGAIAQLVLGILILLLSVTPAVALVLTGLGIRMGDPAAIPDAIAAFGLYVVSCAALAGARHHTTLSPLLVPAHPLGGALAGISLLVGAFRGASPVASKASGPGELSPEDPGGDA